MNSSVKKSLTVLHLTFLLLGINLFGQEKFQAAGIGFYNVENLFDTEVSVGYIDGTRDYQDQLYHISIPILEKDKYPSEECNCRLTEMNLKGKKVFRNLILQEEFIPTGPKAWNEDKYAQKLKNISYVISEIGKDVTKSAPVVVGLVEVENRNVVEDLVVQPLLKDYNYGVVHYNSLDKRGIDCALIYQKDRFKVTESKKYELEVYDVDGDRDYTRDILYVKGLLDGEEMHFLVNHWPSRRGGEAASYPKRVKAAELLKSIFEEIRKTDPNAKIIAMGDFNDDPVSPSIKKIMETEGKKENVEKDDIYNAMETMYKKGFGTLAYRDGWNLFDQIMFSGALVGDDYKQYEMYKTAIFSPSFLVSKEGQYKGYPNRMYGGDTYHADGYADHFPVYTILLRKIVK